MKNNRKRPVVDVDYIQSEPSADSTAQIQDEIKASAAKEVLCGVVLRRCPVISYNKWSNVLVYECDGKLIQTNALEYNGEGYVEVE